MPGKASGLKVSEFCEREGVTPTAFAHERKEIGARDARRAELAEPQFVPARPPSVPEPLEVALPDRRAARGRGTTA